MFIIAAIAVVVAVPVAALAVRWWVWRPVVRRRVVVQTGDASFNGVVLSRRGPLLELGDVTVHTRGMTSKVDGTVIVERSAVNWVQVLV